MGTLIQTFPDGGSGGASAGMIADEFSASVDYAVGDLVIYDKTLYKFTSAHSAGAWDPSDVTDDVTVDSELKLKQNLSDTFNGTLQQWEALPLATKLTYKYANITNDPTEQLEIVSADIDIENHVVHLDGDELVGLNGIWKTQGEYGVKNLILFPYVTDSKTQNAVTFTINFDGSVSLSGTATADASLILMSVEDNAYSGYKMSGGHSHTIYMRQRITDKSGTFVRSTQDYGDGVVLDSINPSTEKYNIMIWVANGAVTDGITIYPMLRSANDTDKTYRPYAKTNKQLTDEISGNTSDIDEIDERLDNTTTAVTGNPISITGLKSNQLAINPVITLEPIQAGSGDPSPSNVRAISGYDKIEVLSCGKNIWNLNIDLLKSLNTEGTWTGNTYAVVGVTFAVEVNSKGIVTKIVANGTPSSGHATLTCYKSHTSIYNDLQLRASGYPVSVGRFLIGSYYLTSEYLNTLYDSIGTIPHEPGGGLHILIQIMNGQTVNNYEIYPMLTLSSVTDTTFEPYNPITDIQLTLGQTIYGGTLDVEKGVLTVDRGYAIFDGSSDEGWEFAGAGYPSLFVVQQELTNCAKGSVTHAYENWFSSYSPSIYYEQSNAGANPHIISYDRVSMYIYFNYGAVITLENFKTNLASHPLQICYELATPLTIQLTPHEISLLKDYAYVSTNGTNMSFSYKNGEMASLGDVAQVGETLNELGELMGNKIGYTKIQNSITITSTSYTVVNDGFLFGMITSTSGQVQYITINDIQVIGVTNNSIPVVFSVKAGDVIKTREGSAFTYLLFIAEFGR